MIDFEKLPIELQVFRIVIGLHQRMDLRPGIAKKNIDNTTYHDRKHDSEHDKQLTTAEISDQQ